MLNPCLSMYSAPSLCRDINDIRASSYRRLVQGYPYPFHLLAKEGSTGHSRKPLITEAKHTTASVNKHQAFRLDKQPRLRDRFFHAAFVARSICITTRHKRLISIITHCSQPYTTEASPQPRPHPRWYLAGRQHAATPPQRPPFPV